MEPDISPAALAVLERRYLERAEDGSVLETPAEMFRRVAENIASAEKKYDPDADIEGLAESFYQMMASLDFLPNSPTLMNAGRAFQQLAACFVIPVEDSTEGIFEAIKDAAIIHQSGGGTGFSFSRLRPRGDIVKTTHGVASGPVSFMKVFDAATEAIKQGGMRRGANMGILRVDHPDIMEFITAKDDPENLVNFNVSVAVTNAFMEAVKEDREYDLLNPRTGETVKRLKAGKVLDLMALMSWKNADPGIIFIDRMNRDNPTPALGEIESTNPCGEQPLLPYEACNLGSVNLAHCVRDGKVDYGRLQETVRLAVRFLDNVIDMSRYPLKRIEEMARGNRKVGLGVMGFADMLIQLGIPYDSEEAVRTAEEVMAFIQKEARAASEALAGERGAFPNFEKSIYAGGPELRNATVTTIAPTGTLCIIAGCSSGIEPVFAVSYIRRALGDREFVMTNPYFEEVAREMGFYSEDLMKRIAEEGTLGGIEDIPEDVKRLFVTAHEVPPEYHVGIQAAFQRHTDNAVSKTVNFPKDATPKDIKKVFLSAYDMGCKGITVYRDGSKEEQVLRVGKEESRRKPKRPAVEACPECGTQSFVRETGCSYCRECGYSRCSL
jgi:ribonucleoside-diphosphate reductase alpha chain